MRYRWMKWGAAIAVTALLAACGSDGKDGLDGAPGQDADPAILADLQEQIDALGEASGAPESCAICHNGDAVANGDSHQAVYDQYYQDGVLKVVTGSMALTVTPVDATYTATLAFRMEKNGQPFDCTTLTGDGGVIGSYFAAYDSATRSFPSDFSIGNSRTYNAGTNTCTITKTGITAAQQATMTNGIVTLYGTADVLYRNSAKRITTGAYPFAGILKLGTVDYGASANVSGCESCHTQPFLKHAYIYGKVTDNDGAETQFYTCKGCHYDNRSGGHEDWQILKDDPARYAEIAAGSAMTAEEEAKYAYKASLMNDVHMSHAMEFAYPQSMKSCVTCHAGKLPMVLATVLESVDPVANKFRAETCISCHSVDGIKAAMAAANYNHQNLVDGTVDALKAADCTVCHATGGAPTFATIHGGGYDPLIYSTAGVRYSDTFVVNVSDASIAGSTLTMEFTATGSLGAMSAADIVPTVMVGLYGYDTKDFLVAAHGRTDGFRNLEYVWGDGNPRFTPVSVTTANGTTTWVLTADLTLWADKLADGSVKRAEIAVMPQLKNAAGQTVGLNAPSKTFNFADNEFENFYDPIVKVMNTSSGGKITGCNTCHDQLATTFHSGIRGGNIVVCRICHVPSSRGSHLEFQSRSIDSYVHAIHSFQPFDIGDVDFDDPVEAIHVEHHINTDFPRFGILDCESCHNPGTYNVPNQGKSLVGVLAGNDVASNGRSIGTYPQVVVGPAARACGACHRSQALNANGGLGDADKLATLISHMKTNGFMIEDADGVWDAIVAKIAAFFN